LEETSGLCGKRTLPPLGNGSRLVGRDDTVFILGGVCFWTGWLFLKDWIPGQARDDTVYSLTVLVSGEPFHHFTISPFHPQRSCRSCCPRSISFPLFVAPIYMGGGVGLICITLPCLDILGVILNLVRDDLRMMASKPVAARAGAMKEKRYCWYYIFIKANIASCPGSLLPSCPIDRPLNAS